MQFLCSAKSKEPYSIQIATPHCFEWWIKFNFHGSSGLHGALASWEIELKSRETKKNVEIKIN